MVTTKTDVTSITDLTKTSKKDSVKIDTDKIHTEIKTVKNIQDSDEVDIISDSGAIQKINIAPGGVFTYTGLAQSIVYKKRSVDRSAINRSIRDNKGETTYTTEADSTSQKQTIHQQIKDKTVDAKAGNSWIGMVIGVIAIVIIAGLLVYKYLKI